VNETRQHGGPVVVREMTNALARRSLAADRCQTDQSLAMDSHSSLASPASHSSDSHFSVVSPVSQNVDGAAVLQAVNRIADVSILHITIDTQSINSNSHLK